MKFFKLTIDQRKVDDVKAALLESGVRGITMSEVRVLDEAPRVLTYRGKHCDAPVTHLVQLDFAVTDDVAQRVPRCVESFIESSQGANENLFMFEGLDALRIRTQEGGSQAL